MSCRHYSYEVTCSVCGGPGMASAKHIGADWFGTKFQHDDSRDCKYYIDKQRLKDQQRIAELEAKLAITPQEP